MRRKASSDEGRSDAPRRCCESNSPLDTPHNLTHKVQGVPGHPGLGDAGAGNGGRAVGTRCSVRASSGKRSQSKASASQGPRCLGRFCAGLLSVSFVSEDGEPDACHVHTDP